MVECRHVYDFFQILASKNPCLERQITLSDGKLIKYNHYCKRALTFNLACTVILMSARVPAVKMIDPLTNNPWKSFASCVDEKSKRVAWGPALNRLMV